MPYTSYKGKVLGGISQAVAKGIFQFAADTVNLANLRSPRATGQMAQSGRVVPQSPTNVRVIFQREGKGGYNVAERMEFDESLKHPGGGQSHFLSSSIETLRPKMPEYIKRYKE